MIQNGIEQLYGAEVAVPDDGLILTEGIHFVNTILNL